MSAPERSLRPRAKIARRSSRLRAEAPTWPEGWAGQKRKSAEAELDDHPEGLDSLSLGASPAGAAHGPTDVENEEAPPLKRQRSHSTSPGGSRRRALRPSWSVPRVKATAMSQAQTKALSPSVKTGEVSIMELPAGCSTLRTPSTYAVWC